MNRESIIAAGIDYDNGVRRLMDKPDLYEKYLRRFFEKNALAELGEQLEAGDYQGAIGTVHGVKGVCGNLSMGRLYDKVCQLSDLLRAGGQGQEALALFQQIMGLYDAAEKAINN